MIDEPSSLIVFGLDRDGRPCVFKQLRPELAAREDLALRLANERDVLTRLRGVGGVIALREVRESPLVLVLERADTSLDAWLVKHPDAVRERRKIAYDLLRAVANIHARGVIHRDIKPSNILLVDGDVRLADFGVAAQGEPPRAVPPGWEEDSVGTPPWAAPELHHRADLHTSPAADVYSAALVVGELVGPDQLPAEFARARARDPEQRPAIERLLATLPR